jgi:hypothetical protein
MIESVPENEDDEEEEEKKISIESRNNVPSPAQSETDAL